MKLPKFNFKFFKKSASKQQPTLSFSELRIKEKKSINNKLKPLVFFLTYLPVYFHKKQRKFLLFLYSFSSKSLKFLFTFKNFAVIKLIWGRGKLGRPLVHIGTIILAGLVFLTGGIFQQNLIVLSQEERDVFITSGSDIVPQPVIVATTLQGNALRDNVTKYTVKSGDTLSSIGQKFNVTVDTIRYANNITNVGYLKVGQEIDIPPVNGIVYKVKSGDTIQTVAREFALSEQAIADFNYLSKPFTLQAGQELVLPDAKIPAPVVAVAPPVSVNVPNGTNITYTGAAYTFIPYASSGRTGTGTFIWPTNYRYITQYFSYYHPALDIARVSPIFASDSGVVIRSGWWTNGYGFAVQIDHRNGYVTTYAHMSRLNVNVGDEVNQGDTIGIMGSTGRSTGPHVHFSIQLNGQYLDPSGFF